MSGIQMVYDFCNYVVKSGVDKCVVLASVVIALACTVTIGIFGAQAFEENLNKLKDSETNGQVLFFAFWVYVSYSFLGWFTGLW